MKNKKFLCLVLALVMVLGAFGPVFAETKAADDKKEETKVEKVEKVTGRDAKIQWLVDHKFVEGRKVNEDPKNNDLALDKTIKRSEITKLLVYAIGRQDLAEKIQGTKIYKDVEATHWANGVITVGTSLSSPANNVPFLNGYPDGTFKPENDVTYGELAKMLVTLVKKDLTKDMHDGANKPGIWPGRWITWATELGILDDVKLEDGNKAAVRSDAFVMLYNALYKMENLRKVPVNETMGIISGYSKGKLVLNQEGYKKEFTVNADTNFVYGRGTNESGSDLDRAGMVNWNDTLIKFGDRDWEDVYLLGSLVRVLADDKGVVTHIIQLGNPVGLYRITNGWRTVADGTIGTNYIEGRNLVTTTVSVGSDRIVFHGGHITDRKGKVTVYDNYDRDLNETDIVNITFKDNEVINLTHETRYFVADYLNGHLTEVKDIAAVKALLDSTENVQDVYAGFDVLPKTGIKEATVVVFNKVDDGNGEVVRVIAPQETNFTFKAHKPNMVKAKAEVVNYDLRNDKVEFPFNKNWEKYDVLNITRRVDGIVVANKLIDGSFDPIYKITKVNDKTIDTFEYVPGRRIDTIELTDEKGTLTVDVRVDTDYFFGDEVKPGAFVQVHFLKKLVGEDNVGNPTYKLIPAVDVISVRDDVDKVRDELPVTLGPKDKREVTGIIASIEPGQDKDRKAFTVKVDGSQYSKTYIAATKALKGFLEGDKVTFLADPASPYAEHDKPFATEFVNHHINEAAPVKTDIKELEEKDTVDEAYAEKVEALNKAYNKLSGQAKKHIGNKLVEKLEKAVEAVAKFRDQQAYDAFVVKVKATTFKFAIHAKKDSVKAGVEEKIKALDGYKTKWNVVVDAEGLPDTGVEDGTTANADKVKVTITPESGLTAQPDFWAIIEGKSE